MPLPVVAIVGRPNVGKSSLFNAIAGRRASIVEPTAGVTRDRVSALCEYDGVYFDLIDTGGHGVVDRDDLSEHVERQIRFAIAQASLILFVVDGRDGLTPLDRSTADLLKRERRRVRLIANKVDEPHMSRNIGEFLRLGFGEPLAVSAMSGLGRIELMGIIAETLRPEAGEAPPDPVMKLALVGKRNAGKSTFINAIAGEERVIVSEVPGTTRDSIDVRFEREGQVFMAIDTAGVRKKSRLNDDIEYYAMVRAEESIRRADVVLLLIDATEPVGQLDKKLAGFIVENYKPCILVVNKWDLAKDRTDTDEFGEYLGKVLVGMDFAPIAFTTAKSGKNIHSVIDLATELFKQAAMRVGTGQLNAILERALAVRAPKAKRGQRAPKLLYATQVSSIPPSIVVFVNSPTLVSPSYERFLINRLREALPFGEIPIRLMFRARRRAPEVTRGHAES
jgi:GTP-binding protein